MGKHQQALEALLAGYFCNERHEPSVSLAATCHVTQNSKKDARHLPIESAVGSGIRNLPRIRIELWNLTRGGIFKLLWRPGIDSMESIPPAYVAWRTGTTTLFLLGS